MRSSGEAANFHTGENNEQFFSAAKRCGRGGGQPSGDGRAIRHEENSRTHEGVLVQLPTLYLELAGCPQ